MAQKKQKLIGTNVFKAEVVRRTSDGFITNGHFAVKEELCDFTAAETRAVVDINPKVTNAISDRPLYTLGHATNLLLEERDSATKKQETFRMLRKGLDLDFEKPIWVNNRYWLAIKGLNHDSDILVLDERSPVLIQQGDEIIAVIMPFGAGKISEAVHSID
jgi:hypothetical protein